MAQCLCFACEFQHSNITDMKHKHSVCHGILMRFSWVQHSPCLQCSQSFPIRITSLGLALYSQDKLCFLNPWMVGENCVWAYVNPRAHLGSAGLDQPLQCSWRGASRTPDRGRREPHFCKDSPHSFTLPSALHKSSSPCSPDRPPLESEKEAFAFPSDRWGN